VIAAARKLPGSAVIATPRLLQNPIVEAALAARIRAGHPQAPVSGRGLQQLFRRVDRELWLRGHRNGLTAWRNTHGARNHGNAKQHKLALARRAE
jgi:hypothetical protein